MANYKITYKGNVIATETNPYDIYINSVQTNDVDDTITTINSNVGKVVGGNTTIDLSTVATDTRYIDYDTTTSFANISTILGGIATRGVYFLFVKIASQLGASTPDCSITLDNGTSTVILLTGLNDFAIIPLNGVLTDSTKVAFKSSGAATLASLEIIAGLGAGIPARVA